MPDYATALYQDAVITEIDWAADSTQLAYTLSYEGDSISVLDTQADVDLGQTDEVVIPVAAATPAIRPGRRPAASSPCSTPASSAASTTSTPARPGPCWSTSTAGWPRRCSRPGAGHGPRLRRQRRPPPLRRRGPPPPPQRAHGASRARLGRHLGRLVSPLQPSPGQRSESVHCVRPPAASRSGCRPPTRSSASGVTATTCGAPATCVRRARRSSISTKTPTGCAAPSCGATAVSSRSAGTRPSP